MEISSWLEFWKNASCQKGKFEELLLSPHFYGIEPVLVTVDSFLDHIATIKSILSIQPGDSIFEVGCGAGLILFPFYKDGHPVGGSDLSPSYLEAAANLIPEAQLEINNAISISAQPRYDYLLSCATANYFPDHGYVASFIEMALQKARKAVYLAQLNDIECKAQYQRINHEAEQLTAWKLFMESFRTDDEKSHNRFFEESERLFFYKDHFLEIGHRHHVTVQILPQAIPNLARAYRFDVAFIK